MSEIEKSSSSGVAKKADAFLATFSIEKHGYRFEKASKKSHFDYFLVAQKGGFERRIKIEMKATSQKFTENSKLFKDLILNSEHEKRLFFDEKGDESTFILRLYICDENNTIMIFFNKEALGSTGKIVPEPRYRVDGKPDETKLITSIDELIK